MDHEEIIAMAKEAGFEVTEHAIKATNVYGEIDEELARFADLVAAKEREAMRQCIVTALIEYTREMEGYSYFGKNPGVSKDDYEDVADAAIRARGQKEGI